MGCSEKRAAGRYIGRAGNDVIDDGILRFARKREGKCRTLQPSRASGTTGGLDPAFGRARADARRKSLVIGGGGGGGHVGEQISDLRENFIKGGVFGGIVARTKKVRNDFAGRRYRRRTSCATGRAGRAAPFRTWLEDRFPPFPFRTIRHREA